MSKSKFFSPGAYDVLKGTVTHVTWSFEKPSRSATAYATADSKPLPLLGSLSTNHGSYAGESVPTVRWPGVCSGRLSVAHWSAVPDPVGEPLAPESVAVSSSCGAQATAPRR